MDIPAKLAVLSACQTADSTLIKGVGFYNLARGFYTAGTERVISNLWPVQDFAASQIMEKFYQEYKRTSNASQALRHAKLAFITNQSDLFLHPFFWAGWIVQKSTFHPETRSMYLSWWIIGVVALLVFTWLALTRWIRRSQ